MDLDDIPASRGLSRFRFPIILFLVVAAAGGTALYVFLRKTGDDAVAETREAMDARFALLQRIGRELTDRPPLESPQAPEWPTPPVLWMGAFADGARTPVANVLVADAETLAAEDHSVSDSPSVVISDSEALYRALHGYGPSDDYDEALAGRRAFLAMRYLVVPHRVEVEQEPAVASGTRLTGERIPVTHGRVACEVYVFDLERDGALLGTVRASGTSQSDEAINIYMSTHTEDVTERLRERMWQSLLENIRIELGG